MKRTTHDTRLVDGNGPGADGFTDGDASSTPPIPPTVLDASVMNSIQEEIATAVETSGQQLDANFNGQLDTAITVRNGFNGSAPSYNITSHGGVDLFVPGATGEQTLGSFNFAGHNGTTFTPATARIIGRSHLTNGTDTWSLTSTPTSLEFHVTEFLSASSRKAAEITPNGDITVFAEHSRPRHLEVAQIGNTDPSSPAATQAGEIGSVGFGGYDGTGYTGPRAYVRGQANETFSGTSHATSLEFYTTPSGGVVPKKNLEILPDGRIQGSVRDVYAISSGARFVISDSGKNSGGSTDSGLSVVPESSYFGSSPNGLRLYGFEVFRPSGGTGTSAEVIMSADFSDYFENDLLKLVNDGVTSVGIVDVGIGHQASASGLVSVNVSYRFNMFGLTNSSPPSVPVVIDGRTAQKGFSTISLSSGLIRTHDSISLDALTNDPLSSTLRIGASMEIIFDITISANSPLTWGRFYIEYVSIGGPKRFIRE